MQRRTVMSREYKVMLRPGARDKPVAVEFSYRYGNKDEEYGGGVTRRAFETAVPHLVNRLASGCADVRTASRVIYDQSRCFPARCSVIQL